MKRLLTLWLPLVAVFWLVRSALEALVGGRTEPPLTGLLALASIPALQAVALGWLTRAPGPSPALALVRALRGRRLPFLLLALDLAVPAAAFAFPDQAWLTPALGDAPDGNPTSLLAGSQALLAAVLFLRGSFQSSAPRRDRLLLALFGFALLGLAALLAVDALGLLGEVLLPASPPLLRKLVFPTPALILLLALLFALQDRLRPAAGTARSGDRRARAAGSAGNAVTALDAAAACGWIALLVSLAASVLAEGSSPLLGAPVALFALAGTTSLVAAGLLAPAKNFPPSGV